MVVLIGREGSRGVLKKQQKKRSERKLSTERRGLEDIVEAQKQAHTLTILLPYISNVCFRSRTGSEELSEL